MGGVGVGGVGAEGAGRGAGRGRGRGRGRGQRDPMIGKTVRITSGRFASFIGTAREVTGKALERCVVDWFLVALATR